MKYRKKPIVIEAIQWTGNNWDELEEFSPYGLTEICGRLTIDTLEGELNVSEGDWIIKGIQGEYYPCKPDIFKDTYEPVKEVKDEG